MRSVIVFASGLLVAASLAGAAVAPTTPTFFVAWGSNGSLAGQFLSPRHIALDVSGNVYVTDSGNNRVQVFDDLGHFLRQWGSFGSANGQFNSVAGITIDPAGNVFVVDQGNSRIQKFTTSGAFLAKWGTIGTGSGQFSSPQGVASDAAGNVYVADFGHRIQKFTGGGTFLQQWGTGGAGNGQFSFPTGVATDSSGNVYVCDLGNNRIQVFTSSGAYLTQWGTPGTGNGQFSSPQGVTVDAVRNVYVVEGGGHRVQKFTSGGTYLTQWGSNGSANGQFNTPIGCAVDPAGNIYVADNSNNRVQKFSGAGASLSWPSPSFAAYIGSYGSGNGQLSSPWGVCADSVGYIYVGDESNHRVEKFTANGVYVTQWGGFGSGNGQLVNPHGLATDAAGNVYVADTDNNRIQKFTSAGGFITKWGFSGSTNGNFSSPFDVALDAAGNVYVADLLNSRVQKFTSTGTYLTQWGTPGSGNGQFTRPSAVATDPAGNVYVVDYFNNRVQKFTSTGTFLAAWGTGGSLNGLFSSPYGIATDALGDVYVTDSGNGRIQKFHGDGSFVAVWGVGQLLTAAGIDVDAAGNIYVVDFSAAANRVVKFVAPPAVALCSDVANDQGRQVRLRLLRGSSDAPGSGTITGYAVYRRVDAAPAATLARPDRVVPAGAALAGWDYLGMQPAAGDPEYAMVVPTLADANSSLVTYTAFMVRALTADPLTHYDSGIEYGYSIDNLSPAAPSPFAAAYSASATHLHWGVSAAPDFATFRLYRGASAGFTPGPGNLVTATTDTGFADPGPAGNYYKLSAVDLNGNESPFSLAGPGQTTGVDDARSAMLALEPVRPNPAKGGALEIAFTLPSGSPARLEVLDVMGRCVVQREVGALGVGRHTLSLAGARLSPGLYLVRLCRGAEVRSTRVIVLD